jgi:uncharacterized protein YraI
MIAGAFHGPQKGLQMSLSRAAALATILLPLLVSPVLAKPTAVVAEVNLRDTPATSGKILALIPKGTQVEIATCTNGWCQVSFNGQQGYAISKNLGIAQPRRVVRRPIPQVYADGAPVYDPGPVYVGPPPYAYYGYYGPYYRPYWGPRWGWGWRGGWGFRHRW